MLFNDLPVIRTITTIPATPDLEIDFRFARGTMDVLGFSEERESFESVKITPLNGHTVKTDANGLAQFQMQAGPGGQG